MIDCPVSYHTLYTCMVVMCHMYTVHVFVVYYQYMNVCVHLIYTRIVQHYVHMMCTMTTRCADGTVADHIHIFDT